jgi:hypothetical protein
MHSPKPDTRRITHAGAAKTSMSISQYVDLVDQLLEQKEFTPEVKKPPQPVR